MKLAKLLAAAALMFVTTSGYAQQAHVASDTFAAAIRANREILIGNDHSLNEDEILAQYSLLSKQERLSLNLSRMKSVALLADPTTTVEPILLATGRGAAEVFRIPRHIEETSERRITSKPRLTGDQDLFIFVRAPLPPQAQGVANKLNVEGSPFHNQIVYGLLDTIVGFKVVSEVESFDGRSVLRPAEVTDLRRIVRIYKRFGTITKQQFLGLQTTFGKNLANKLFPPARLDCATCATECESCACNFDEICAGGEHYGNCPSDCDPSTNPPVCMPCEVNLNNRCQPLRCENGAQCKVINGQSTCHYCGNGVVDVSEQCDDGNSVNTDRCSNTCKAARCGDGVKQTGEQCDDGNRRSNDSCTNTCALPRCGDGIKQNREECDDGNRNNGDRCSNRCRRNR